LVGSALHCLSCSALPGRSGSQHFQCSAICSGFPLTLFCFACLLRCLLRPPESDPSGSAPLDRPPRIGSSRLGPSRLGPLARHPSARPPSARPTRLGPLGSNPSARPPSVRLPSARSPSAASAFGCSHSLPVYRSDTSAFRAWLSRFLAFLAMDYFSRSGALAPHHSVVPAPRLSRAHPLEYSAVSSSAWQLWCSPALIDRSRQRSAALTLGA
jgi:hypothetical protein